MHFIRGYYRLSLCSLFLIIGATFIIVTSFIPVKIGRYSLAMWCLNFTVRCLLWVLNIKVSCDEPYKLRELHGFIFPNHVTYLDTLIIPAITLFPEGKRGPGHAMLPFRYGAFEIVTHTRSPFLPVVIVYDRLDIAIWHRSEPILKALWRLAAKKGSLTATITPLEVIAPTPEDDPVVLSKQVQAQIQSTLWELS